MTGPLNDEIIDLVEPVSKPLSPVQFIELVDEFYEDAKKNRVSRFDVKWGVWSAQMNREINHRIKSEDPEKEGLINVIFYWALKSQLLELYYKTPLFGAFKRMQLEGEIKNIKDNILSGKSLKINSIEDLAQKILRLDNESSERRA